MSLLNIVAQTVSFFSLQSMSRVTATFFSGCSGSYRRCMIVNHTMLSLHSRNRLFLDGCMLAVVCGSLYRSARETQNIAPSRLVRLLVRDGESIASIHHSRSYDTSRRLFVLSRKNSQRWSRMSILTSMQAALFNVLFSMVCWYVVLIDMLHSFHPIICQSGPSIVR